MPAPNIVLLDEARARRAKAQHVRELCQTLLDTKAIEALTGYAEELEKQAADLEATVGRTARLSGDIASEIAKARETIAQINDTLAKNIPAADRASRSHFMNSKPIRRAALSAKR